MNINLPDTRHFYGGKHQEPMSNDVFYSINPATEEIIAKIPEANKSDIDAAVEAAKIAFEEWKNIDPIEKGRIISSIADAIEEHAEELAWIDVIDAGRPILDAKEDIEAVQRMFRYFAGIPDKIDGYTIPVSGEKTVYTIREQLLVLIRLMKRSALQMKAIMDWPVEYGRKIFVKCITLYRELNVVLCGVTLCLLNFQVHQQADIKILVMVENMVKRQLLNILKLRQHGFVRTIIILIGYKIR